MPKLFGSKLVEKEVKTDKLFPVSQWCYVSELINNPGQKAAFRQIFSISSELSLAEHRILSASRSHPCCYFLSKLSNENPNTSSSSFKSISRLIGCIPSERIPKIPKSKQNQKHLDIACECRGSRAGTSCCKIKPLLVSCWIGNTVIKSSKIDSFSPT